MTDVLPAPGVPEERLLATALAVEHQASTRPPAPCAASPRRGWRRTLASRGYMQVSGEGLSAAVDDGPCWPATCA